MSITLEFPQEMEQRLRREVPNLEAEARIAVGLELFRKEQISIYELRQMLGLTRSEVNRLLIDRDEWAQSLTLEDVENDFRSIAKTNAASGQ